MKKKYSDKEFQKARMSLSKDSVSGGVVVPRKKGFKPMKKLSNKALAKAEDMGKR